jgi:prepilin peptidase CpaA
MTMRYSQLLSYVPLIVLLVCAAVQDLRERRIRNWLTFALVLSGFAQSIGAVATVSPAQSGLGFLIGLALPLTMFAIGALGGGDVKLLAGVGAWLGPLAVLQVFAAAALIGMVIVLVQAIATGRLRAVVRNSTVIAVNLWHVSEIGLEQATATGRACRALERPLPYAVPVLAAVSAVLYVMFRGGHL